MFQGRCKKSAPASIVARNYEYNTGRSKFLAAALEQTLKFTFTQFCEKPLRHVLPKQASFAESTRVVSNNYSSQTLIKKEQGDWKNLTAEEKKSLYRHSFCQTFSEFQAPNGSGKYIIGSLFAGFGVVLWVFMAIKVFIMPPLRFSGNQEYQSAVLRRMIDQRVWRRNLCVR